jgi:hypothetical protein
MTRHARLVAFEIHLGGQRVVKEVLALRGGIRSAFVRGPIRSGWDEATMRSLREIIDAVGLLATGRPS